jgi:hypothetical protein
MRQIWDLDTLKEVEFDEPIDKRDSQRAVSTCWSLLVMQWRAWRTQSFMLCHSDEYANGGKTQSNARGLVEQCGEDKLHEVERVWSQTLIDGEWGCLQVWEWWYKRMMLRIRTIIEQRLAFSMKGIERDDWYPDSLLPHPLNHSLVIWIDYTPWKWF